MKLEVLGKRTDISTLPRNGRARGSSVRSGATGNARVAGSNTLRVRIPWLFEVESVGLIPVGAAFLLCAMVIVGLAFR